MADSELTCTWRILSSATLPLANARGARRQEVLDLGIMASFPRPPPQKRKFPSVPNNAITLHCWQLTASPAVKLHAACVSRSIPITRCLLTALITAWNHNTVYGAHRQDLDPCLRHGDPHTQRIPSLPAHGLDLRPVSLLWRFLHTADSKLAHTRQIPRGAARGATVGVNRISFNSNVTHHS
ncbi:hypothetical protein K438DRAFT_1771492 [Mycena galopus ATCC 62051]|nr:hypothetical protein K438DRAFT_1771492 [Mycena galopus ATCC 62051]